MAGKQTHIIQRQVFELGSKGSRNAFEWQQEADRYWREIIAPALEECFGDISPEQHLIIDKLEIDLGSFSKEGFNNDAKKKLIQLLGDKLRSYCSIKNNSSSNTDNDEIAETENRPIVVSQEKATKMLLQYFLQKGYFPWWYKKPAGTIQLEELFSIAWLHSLSQPDKEELKETLLTGSDAPIRLVNHFSAVWLDQFLPAIGLPVQDALHQWESIAVVIKEFPGLQTIFHQHFWIALIKAVSAGKKYPDIVTVVKNTAGNNTIEKDNQLFITLLKALQIISRQNSINPAFATYAAAIDKKLESFFNDQLLAETAGENSLTDPVDETDEQLHYSLLDTIEEKEDRLLTIEEILAEMSGGSVHQKKVRDDQEKETIKKKKKSNSKDEQEGLFITATGLVILHPFLTELFSSTGLWKEDDWSSDTAAFRAVQLLSYLSHGDNALPEYELIFHKILTGIDTETALPAITPLTTEETVACDELLQAVITHWTALRNTGADGLREGFLQRAGKITLADKGYLVQVENQAQDVLLSRLPWGYSMIKLPWLSQLLHISWI